MMSWQAGLYVAAVMVPLAAFVVEFLGGRLLGRKNAHVAAAAIGLSFALSLVGFVDYFLVEAHSDVFARRGDAVGPARPVAWTASAPWVAIGEGVASPRVAPALEIPIGIRIDNVAVVMFLMVTFVGTLIHVYSMGYMRDDPRYPRFFAYLSLFCFAMLGLVAADNLFLVFVFWELVGLCSYLLIGFWHEGEGNGLAADKAFLVNRVGDVGMLVGMGVLWSALGTFDIEAINRGLRDADGRLRVTTGDVVAMTDGATGDPVIEPAGGQPRQVPVWLLTVAGLGIFAGCAGKSAQFPLHVWLPDAMAGPTPVSALVHAATMVAAGVYLVARFFPVFTEPALLVIAYTGGITLFIGATIAMVQTDYKKVLAYSTVSQLGFMMLGLGVGGRAAGLFHLMTHACFKALLFLGAGVVYRAVHTYEMPALGGLYRPMRWTALAMLAATLAIAGVPPFSGFYSKDAILASSIHFVFEGGRYEHVLLFLLPAVGAALTAFYMFRMWFLLFGGAPRGRPAVVPDRKAGEGGRLMLWPLFALAVPTIAVGWPWIILPLPGFRPVLERLLEYGEPMSATDPASVHLYATAASLLIATIGVGLGFLYYSPGERWRKFDPARVAARYAPIHNFLVHKWYFDELYDAVLVRPTLTLARWAGVLDRRGIDGLVDGSARAVERLSRVDGRLDERLVDGLAVGAADLVAGLGGLGRGLQTGRLRHYLMALAVAVVGLSAGVFAWVLG